MIKKLILWAVVALGIGWAVPGTRAVLKEKAAPLVHSFKTKLTVRRLEAMADQLTARVNRGEGFPASFDGWLRREFASPPDDPWGNLYYLQTRRDGFVVGSAGPDGRPGTDDDIQHQRRLR
ncbi:MAG: type II secretion system protein GspG [Gemmatimonadota bacterium]